MPEHRRDQADPIPGYPPLPPPGGLHNPQTWAHGGPVHFEPGTEGFAQFAPEPGRTAPPNAFLGRSTPPADPTPPKRRSPSRRTVILVAVGAVLALVGLGVAVDASTNETTTSNAAAGVKPNPMPPLSSEQAAANSSAASQPAATGNDDPGTAAIGDTVTYEDGTQVTVTSVKRTTFSDTSYGARGTGIEVIVRIKNGGDAVLDAAMATIDVTYGDNGESADQVFDVERGFNGGFEAKISPGRTATGKYGFAVPKTAKNLSIQVTPDFDSETAIFEGPIA